MTVRQRAEALLVDLDGVLRRWDPAAGGPGDLPYLRAALGLDSNGSRRAV